MTTYLLAVPLLALAAHGGGGPRPELCRFDKRINGTTYTFDLSPLRRDEGWTWTRPGADPKNLDYKYLFAVCHTITRPPQSCVGLGDSMGYRVSTGSHMFMHGLTCVDLGDGTLHPNTRLIDKNDPLKGVIVKYHRPARNDPITSKDIPEAWQHSGTSMGFQLTKKQSDTFIKILTPCHDQERVVTYHLICSPHFNQGPIQVFEDTEQCHLNVTWPSKFGCPTNMVASTKGYVPSLASRIRTPKAHGVHYERDSGLTFSELGGWWIVGIVVVTFCIPLTVQQIASTSHACSRGRPGKGRKKRYQKVKHDEDDIDDVDVDVDVDSDLGPASVPIESIVRGRGTRRHRM